MLFAELVTPEAIGPIGALLALAFVAGPPVWIASSRLIPNRKEIKTKIVATCEDANAPPGKGGKKAEFHGNDDLSRAVANAINSSTTTEIEERQRRDKEIADKQHATFEELRALRASSFEDYNRLRTEAMDDFRAMRVQMNEEFRQVMHWLRNVVQIAFNADIPEPPKSKADVTEKPPSKS